MSRLFVKIQVRRLYAYPRHRRRLPRLRHLPQRSTPIEFALRIWWALGEPPPSNPHCIILHRVRQTLQAIAFLTRKKLMPLDACFILPFIFRVSRSTEPFHYLNLVGFKYQSYISKIQTEFERNKTESTINMNRIARDPGTGTALWTRRISEQGKKRKYFSLEFYKEILVKRVVIFKFVLFHR